MIIRCPHCDHTRTINSDKIPPNAELATCPRCKNRFRFRALEKADAPVFDSPRDQDGGQPDRGSRNPAGKRPAAGRPKPSPAPLSAPAEEAAPPAKAKPAILTQPEQPRTLYAVQEVQRPQSAFREAAEKAGTDVWDAVDVLHQRWENQMDQHVTEVVTPRPLSADAAPQQRPPRRAPRPETARGPLAENQESEAAPWRERSGQEGATPFPAMSDLYDSMAEEEEGPEDKQPLPPLPDIAPRTLVNYSEQGSSPEDIVEQDIKILQHSPEEQRPTRDLGKLNAIREANEASGLENALRENAPQIPASQITASQSAASETQENAAPKPARPTAFIPTPAEEQREEVDAPAPPEAEEEASLAPWENMKEYGGWFKALLTTIFLVMLRAPSFYSNLGKTGAPLKHCYLFFLILGYVAIIGSVLWAEITMLIIQDAAPLVDNLLTLPVLLVTAPLLLGLMQLFVTGCMRLQLKLLAPERSDFASSFRITAYSVAPFVMCLVPFVGPSIAAVWFAFALTTGCRYALGLSWVNAVAVTLPPAGLLIGGLCWFFLS